MRSIFGWPDRVMSSSRIGRASSRTVPDLPVWDTARIAFPAAGSRAVSPDYEFFNYLIDNDLREDALTLSQSAYAPSDTLDFLRGWALFGRRNLSQASEFFSRVPLSSPFGARSLFYDAVSQEYLGNYDRAASRLPSQEGTEYSELAALHGAGIALLRNDRQEWDRCSSRFTYSDYRLSESERVFLEISGSRFSARSKRPGVAALASALVPGAGKIYAGRLGEGVAAFLTVGALGAITAENGIRHGVRDWRTVAAGSLCAFFYVGNIYGSYLSVSIENDERIRSENTLLLYHLHIPLRDFFR